MFYTVARALVWAFMHIVFRIRVTGASRIPAKGGVLLCANHSSLWDPLTLAICVKRPVHFVGKKELFKYKPFAFVLRHVNAFPIDRDNTDMKAFKKAVELLKGGRVVGIFAQGRRIKEQDLKSAKAGVALFALKSGAGIVPVAINSTYKPFSRINVCIGQVNTLSEYRDMRVKTELLNEITDKVMLEISEMM